jgi:hypothetical protein
VVTVTDRNAAASPIVAAARAERTASRIDQSALVTVMAVMGTSVGWENGAWKKKEMLNIEC